MHNKFSSLREKLTPNVRKVIANALWLFTEKVWQLGLGLVVGLWVARYLGPEQFGVLNYAMAVMGVVSPIAKMGLDNILIRDLARNPEEKEEILGSAFILKFFSSIGAFCLTVSFVSLTNRTGYLIPLLVGILSFGLVLQSIDVIDFWFQSQTQAKFSVWARNFAYIVMSGVRLLLILLQAPLVMFAIAMTVELGLASLGMIILYRQQGNSFFNWKPQLARMKTLVNDSWPLILAGIVIILYMRIDQIMLKEMVGDRSVGIYSAAVKISELWYFVPAAVINSVYPSVIRSKAKGEDIYYSRIQKLFDLMSLLAYGVAIPVTFLSPFLVQILYGQKYLGAENILIIHIWAGLFVSLGLAREIWITNEGLMRFAAVTTAIGAVVNICLNLLWIPQYQGVGAAFATIIAQMFSTYLVSAFYAPTRRIFWSQTRALFLIHPMQRLWRLVRRN